MVSMFVVYFPFIIWPVCRVFFSGLLFYALWVQAGEFVSDVGSSGRSDEKSRAVQGYKAQSEMVIESLDRLIG